MAIKSAITYSIHSLSEEELRLLERLRTELNAKKDQGGGCNA
jgi:hypothetical protein